MKTSREQVPRPLLSRFRGRFARGMLLLGMFLSVLPPVRLRAEDEMSADPPLPVNDTWWGDVWRWIDGGQQWFAYQNVGQWGDDDDDDIPNGLDPYPWDASNNTGWLRASNVWSDAVLHETLEWSYASDRSWQLDWYDSDGDGLPNWCDPRPYDAANNTAWWSGEYQIDGTLRQLGGVFAAGGLDWADYDSDGIPNFIDPYPHDAGNNNSATPGQDSDGDGLGDESDPYPYDSASNAWDYSYASTMWWDWGDNDADGLPNFSDPYPWDSTNNTTQWFAPQPLLVDGLLQTPGGSYATDAIDWNDYDGDGLPTFADPYPYDATNNTTQWSSTQDYLVDGAARSVAGSYATSGLDWNDDDGDGLPNFADPYPQDPDNNTALWLAQTWVDGAAQDVLGAYAASTDTSTWSDLDEDGLPDWLDPYPEDADNNTAWWWGNAWIDGGMQDIAGTYAANESATISWEDTDADGLPDWLDPYPQDAGNNTAWWMDEAYVDGELQTLMASYAADAAPTLSWEDRDFDGLPDWCDPYPDDFANNTIWWEDTFLIDGVRVTVSGIFANEGQDWDDNDGDWIPDFLDPYPADPANNTAFWNGAAWIDGKWEEIAAPYAASNAETLDLTDSDGDSLPDVFDPYPADTSNNTSFWNGGEFVIDGTRQTLPGDATPYATNLEDADGDGLPAFADPYPEDAGNGPVPVVEAAEMAPSSLDTLFEADRIFYGGPTINWGMLAHIDGVLYEVGGTFAENGPDWNDDDGDLLPNFLDPYPADPANNTSFWEGTAMIDGEMEELHVPYAADQLAALDLEDADGDLLPNAFDPYPEDNTNNTSYWGGGDFLIDGAWQTFAGDGRAYATDADDADSDLLPDFADPYPYDETNTALPPEPTTQVESGTMTSGGSSDAAQALQSTLQQPAANNGSLPVLSAPQISTPEVSGPQVAAPQVAPQIVTPQVIVMPPLTPEQAIAALAGQLPEQMTSAQADNGSQGVAGGVPSAPPAQPFVQVAKPTEADSDGDGLDDLAEALTHLTNPTDPDTDDDGLFDDWEIAHALNPLDATDIQRDTDNDGLTNAEELVEKTDPGKADMDGGGASDKEEVEHRRLRRLLEEQGVPPEEMAALLPPGATSYDPYDPQDDKTPDEEDQPPEDPENPEPPGPSEPPTPPDHEDEQGDPLQDGGDGQNDSDGEGGGGDAPPPPPRVDNDQDGWTADIDPDDSDPTVPGQPPPPPPPPPPQKPPGENLLEKVAREKKEKQDAHQKRNKELSKARQVRRDKRAEARQAAHDYNHLMGHPHGNHGDGVKVAGTRGTQDIFNPNGALAFVPTAEYARSHGYQNILRTNQNTGGPRQAWSADGWSLAEQEQMRQQAQTDRNTRLRAEREAGVDRRAAERQAQQDMNDLLSHPHGNHGNGVKTPGARGTRSDLNEDGALLFQPSKWYAKTDAYKDQRDENEFNQFVRDLFPVHKASNLRGQEIPNPDNRPSLAKQLVPELDAAVEPKLAREMQQSQQPQRREFGDLSAAERQGVLSHLDRHAAATGVTVEMVRSNPAKAAGLLSHQIDTLINDPTKATAPVRNVFANRPAFAGGLGAAAGFADAGGAGINGGDVGVAVENQGLGGDINPYQNGTPSWHQNGDQDADHDGVSNWDEYESGFDPDDASNTPTAAELAELERQRIEAAKTFAQRQAERQAAERERLRLEAEAWQRTLEAEHEAQREYELYHPELARQDADRMLTENFTPIVKVDENGRPLMLVRRTGPDGQEEDVWATPKDLELADNFVQNSAGEWEPRGEQERYRKFADERFVSDYLAPSMRKAESSLDAFVEVNLTAASIVAGGAGATGAAPRIIAMSKEALSEFTGLPVGLKDLKDGIKALFTKKIIKQADDIADTASVAANNGVRVASGMGGEVLPMQVVRTLPPGTAGGVVNEAKALTFATGNEHAVVRLATGERALVSGGPGGIDMGTQVTRIIGHTHPYGTMSAGASAADRAALQTLGQRHSYILEGGQVLRFGPNP